VPRRKRAPAPLPEPPTPPPQPTSAADPNCPAWIDYVCGQGGGFVAKAGAPQPDGETRVRVLKARAVPQVQVGTREDGRPEVLYLETVEGVGIGAPTRDALQERREGVLLGQASERETIRAALGPVIERVGATEVPPKNTSNASTTNARPRWDRHRRQIWLGEELLYTYTRHAPAQFAILDTLQKADWPSSIVNPVTHFSIKDTVESLNKRLDATRLRIQRLEQDTQIGWRLTHV